MILGFLQIFMLVLGCMTLVLCMIMFASKSAFKKLSQLCNRSFSTRKMLKPFEITRQIDIFSVFQARTVFVLVLICGSVSLMQILYRFEVERFAENFTKNLPNMSSTAVVISQILYWLLVVSLGSSIIISVLAFIKPSVFHNMNEKTSLWISTRKGYKSLDVSRNIDEALFVYHKHIGILGMVASLVMIISVLSLMLK